jgi:hypothetical protein
MADLPSSKKLADALLTGVLEVAIGAVALGVIAYLLGLFGGDWDTDKKTVVAGGVLLLCISLPFLFLLIKRTFTDTLGRRYMSERTGIVLTFPNLEACKEAMREDFRRAQHVRLLLQIGRKELGYHEASFFYKLAKDKDAGSTVKILRASDDSPFFSKARARARGNDHDRWMEHIRRLGSEIDDLRRSNSKIHLEERLHHEPFLWRIFIFDDIAYISAYLVSKDVDLKCAVYRVERVREGGDNSLYTVFEKYFDYLWQKYDPTDTRGPQERWASWK